MDGDEGSGEQTGLLESRDHTDISQTAPGNLLATAPGERRSSNQNAEFASSPVTEDQTVQWIRVALIFVTGAFSLPTFIAGIDVFAAHAQSAVAAILAGNLILAVVGSLCGAIGARTRLSSYALAGIAFGKHGAAMINLAFAVSLLGWFGVNLNLFSRCVLRLLREEVPGSEEGDNSQWIPSLNVVVELMGGIIMTTTTMYGFRALEALSLLLAPVLAVVTGLLIAKSLASMQLMSNIIGDNLEGLEIMTLANDISRTAKNDEDSSSSSDELMSFGQAISSVVGLSIVGAIITPDYTRFIREWHGAVYSAFLAFVGITSVVEFAGGMASVAFGSHDLLDIMVGIGLKWEAFVVIIAGSWILNAMNLYSASLSVEATVPSFESRTCVGVLGLLGTLVAFANILDSFLTFLLSLSILFAPVAGVIAVDYVILRRTIYDTHDPLLDRPAFMPFALLAWMSGAVIAVLGWTNVISFTGIAALDAFVVAAVLYYGMSFCRY